MNLYGTINKNNKNRKIIKIIKDLKSNNRLITYEILINKKFFDKKIIKHCIQKYKLKKNIMLKLSNTC